LTEEEWFRPIDVERALAFIAPRLSLRRQRLLACAWARAQPAFVDYAYLAEALRLAERLADGVPLAPGIIVPHPPISLGWREYVINEPQFVFRGQRYSIGDLGGLLDESINLAQFVRSLISMSGRRRHPVLPTLQPLRDIVGNPFRAIALDPRLRTADTVGLARGIYEDRAFDRMPLLADALMDAGCEDEQVISHCRGGGPHVRGCWVVDLVLGKE